MPARIFIVGGCFAAGIVFADRIRPGPALALGSGMAAVVALSFAWYGHRRPATMPGELLPQLALPATAAVLLAAGALGFADAALHSSALERAILPSRAATSAVIEGKVAGEPRQAGRAFVLPLQVLRVDGRSTREKTQVSIYGSDRPLSLGDEVRLRAEVSALDLSDPFDRRLRRQRVASRTTGSAAELDVLGKTHNPLLEWANHLRATMISAAGAVTDRDAAGLVLGLSIGDERLISEETTQAFRVSGLSHLTAVSGANVAMVLAALFLVLKALKVGRRGRVPIAIGVITFFALVTRWEPSVLRASVMAGLGLLAFFFGRRSDPLHGLGLAFLVLAALDPFVLWSVGFQLSFAAAAGIIVCSPSLIRRFDGLPRPAATALAVGVSAQASVTPLLAFHFERISTWAIPANLAAFGLVAPATVLGLTGGLAGLVSPGAGKALFMAASIPAAALRSIARFFAGLPAASLQASGLTVVELTAAYVVVAAALWALISGGRRARAAAALGVLIALTVWNLPASSSPPRDRLRVTFFDVGQGDASLVESPAGARVLIDGGPDGEQVARLLRRRGIRRVDLVVVSHAHADHVRGLAEVIEGFEVREAIHPGVEAPALRHLGMLDDLTPAAAGGRLQIGDLTIEVLWPEHGVLAAARAEAEARVAERSGSALNDASLVVRISWRGACALFPGDLEEHGQRLLVAGHESAVECVLLKAPHHGSPKILDEFVDAVDAEWVAVSVGPNDYGHPSRRAIRLFEEAGGRVLRTDRQGDIVVELEPAGR